MKNPVSVLRTTTAIMISLSLVGANGAAAGTGVQAFQLAQADQVQGAGEAEATGQAVAGSEGAEAEAAEGAEAEVQAGEAEVQVEAQSEQAVEAQPEQAAEPQPEQAAEPQATEAQAAEGETTSVDQTEAEAPAGDLSVTETPPAEGTAEQAAEGGAETVIEAQATDTQATDTQATETQATGTQESGVQATETQATETQATETQATETQATGTQESGVQATETQATETQATETQATETQATETQEAETQESEAQESEAQATETQEAETQEAETQESEAQATETQATETQATETQAAEQETTDQQAAETDEAEVVEEVSEEEIEEATSAGEDVVVEEETTAADLQAQLEELRQQQVDLQTQLNEAAATSEEEVVTDETSRSADEEAVVRDDDDDNEIWKYLGAAAAGAAVGAIVPALGGRLVQDQGDRVIVERGGEFFVRSDENQLLRQPGTTVQTEEFESGITRTTVTREDGSKIVTVRNPGGFILRRTRITPDGQEIVLLQQTPEEVYSFGEWEDTLPEVTAHKVQTVDYSDASSAELHDALYAQPTYDFERSFPLQAVREVERVRELVPAVDLPINFASGSAAIERTEVEELTQLGRMMADAVEENPREIFLVEGHTDAVGSNLMNLALSDRRAEAVALALTQYFDVPPENLVVQGYGERYLKEETEASSATNRRATVRRITPLIDQVASR